MVLPFFSLILTFSNRDYKEIVVRKKQLARGKLLVETVAGDIFLSKLFAHRRDEIKIVFWCGAKFWLARI